MVYNVEKSYEDKLDARKSRNFSLFNTSHEFLLDQKKIFTGTFTDFSQYLITWFLIVVRQVVSNFDSSQVVHALELVINSALYSYLFGLGSQKNVERLSWS